VAGTALPNLGAEIRYTWVGPGTFTQSGGPDIVVPSGYMGVLSWDGSEWSLSQSAELPMPIIDSTDTILEESDKLTTEKAIKNYTIPKYSKRSLPFGYGFTESDRPDAPEIKAPEIVDSLGNLITNNNSGFSFLPDFDRPDIHGTVIIDANGNVVKKDLFSNVSVGADGGKSMTDLFYQPSNATDYNICGDNFGEYSELIGMWDEFLRESEYVTKSKIGESSETGKSIYRYDFNSQTASKKVLVFAGTHASEAHTVMMTYNFFRDLMFNFDKNEGLRWVRQNVHFVVVPLVSPDSWGVYSERKRRVWETDPFPATWTKTGNDCVIEFDISDFPTNNPNVSANDYFSNQGIVNKTYLTIRNSGSVDLPDYSYLITESISGQSVKVLVPSNTNNGNGTCEIYVSTDPNRNMQVQGRWGDYTSSSNIVAIGEDIPTSFDNKGTKPFSLGEMKAVKELIDYNDDAVYALDLHTGAGVYNFRYDGEESKNFIDEMNSFFELYTDQINTEESSGLDKPGTIATYGVYEKGMNAFTAEWQVGCNITAERMEEMQRWMGNLIIQGSNYFN
ncbi:MAG TPA: hypothetical protein H9853_06565, partial [Candidatus Sphingobacterium stercoripullorum]|nr:hypothetical protein [Candidatus Sphingobacterium stercoripullorum]